MTQVADKIPETAKNPCVFEEFFDSESEVSQARAFEYRQLPPPASPATSCDFNLFFGFFFDGTRNNYNQCAENEAYSNVARLYDCYPGQVVPDVVAGDNSWEEVIFDGSVFWALENNGYLGKSADGVIWKSVGIKDNSGLKLNFLNGFCSHG